MQRLRHLLAALAAITLVLSAVSSINPTFFVQPSAFAEDDDNADEDHHDSSNGSNNNDDDQEDDDQQTSHDSKETHDNAGKRNDQNATNSEDDEEYDHGQDNNGKQKSKIHVEDNGVEVEIEVSHTNMTDGAYTIALVCEDPSVNKTLDSMFEVNHGEGKLDAKIVLENGTYSGCELVIVNSNTVIASFDSFTVQDDIEEDDDNKGETEKQRRHDIITSSSGKEIHKRHLRANPASPGEYKPGWNYSLVADGSAVNNETNNANAAISIDMAVWKSTNAIILLDITNGTVIIDDHEYDIKIGYALYSPEHGVMRIGALIADDSDILKLKLRGNATEGAEFPMQSGQSIDISFVGHTDSLGNGLENWTLDLESTLKVG